MARWERPRGRASLPVTEACVRIAASVAASAAADSTAATRAERLYPASPLASPSHDERAPLYAAPAECSVHAGAREPAVHASGAVEMENVGRLACGEGHTAAGVADCG